MSPFSLRPSVSRPTAARRFDLRVNHRQPKIRLIQLAISQPKSSDAATHPVVIEWRSRARQPYCETRKRYRTSPRALADTDAVTVEMDHSVVAAGIDYLSNIGRDIPLLVVGGVAVVGALLSWRFASKRAAQAEQRLADIDKRLDGPSTRELCGELARIITPYRSGTFGKPIEDRLPPERRFLRNLRVQLRLSRQRRQQIEAMHAANLAECTRLREELDSIRQAADDAANAIAKVTMMPGPAGAPPEAPTVENAVAPTPPQPSIDEVVPIDPAPAIVPESNDLTRADEDHENPVGPGSTTDAEDPTRDAVDDDVAGLVFTAMDEPAQERPTDDTESSELDALAHDIDAIDSPLPILDADDQPIDFDTLLAESVAKLGGPAPDDESLGGVAAFENQLADAGFGPDAPDTHEATDALVDDDASARIPEPPVADDTLMNEPTVESNEQIAADADAVDSMDDAPIDDATGDDVSAMQTAASSCDDSSSDSKKKLTPDESIEPERAAPTPLVSEDATPSSESPADVKPAADTSTPLPVTDELGFHQGIDDVFSDIDALMSDEILDADEAAATDSQGDTASKVVTPQADESCDTPTVDASDEMTAHAIPLESSGVAPQAECDADSPAENDSSDKREVEPRQTADAASTNLVSKAKADIAAAIERADRSRQALETLDESLNENLTHRREMFSRIDSALAERQIQLVTDILRAEAEHLSLTEALDQIRANVDVMQTDVSRLLGGKPDDGGNPPKH